MELSFCVDQFCRGLTDENASVAEDFNAGGDVLLIAFGGLAGELGMPPYEFFNITNDLMVNKLYLRDIDQAWYHLGLRNYAKNIHGVAGFLRERVRASGASRVVMVGNSAGGYAAILFGLLLDPDLVLAFSPQTFIDKLNRFLYSDSRWRKEVRKVCAYPLSCREFFDLKKVFGAAPQGKCRYHLYYSTKGRVDVRHARRMNGVENVVLHPHTESEDHAVVKFLKEDGSLRRILVDALFP